MLSPWILVASLAAGLAVALAVQGAVTFFLRPRPGRARALDFEFDRRQRLRQASRIYRYAEPLIEWLLRRGPGQNPARLRTIRHALGAADEAVPWEPGEYLAACQVQAMLFALGTALLVLFFFGSGWFALVSAAGMAYVRQRRLLRKLLARAQSRVLTVKRRLPFAVDLMALMMEAGASFQESLGTVVRESAGHPLGDEFGEVLRQIEHGRTRQEALRALSQRLEDADVADLVFAVVKGEELGTPLAQILRGQAEQMRLKRSQWAEQASAEAHVNIVFPGMVIMIACLVIVVAPFIIEALQGNGL